MIIYFGALAAAAAAQAAHSAPPSPPAQHISAMSRMDHSRTDRPETARHVGGCRIDGADGPAEWRIGTTRSGQAHDQGHSGQ